MSLLSSTYHLIEPKLPTQCRPETELLVRISSTFHTCIPTHLALLSTVLGSLSIVAWLFAQLPQIYKNYTLRSTSGLSIFFLAEWLLGDLSNLLGCLFTGQASWQIVIAAYYCSVDCVLVGQWFWYEHLQHGRHWRYVWARLSRSSSHLEVLTGEPVEDFPSSSSDPTDAKAKYLHHHPSDPVAVSLFRTPNFARHEPSSGVGSASSSPASSSNRRDILRATSALPSPSPKTTLYLTLLLALLTQTPCTHASPLHHTITTTSSPSSPQSPTALAGTLLSWLSTVLYLSSRLPQLIHNHRRRSTAGLAPALFLAAFHGNLFYAASLAANPRAWRSFAGPDDSRGWVVEGPSDRADWVARALPFFLGAAGVLVMDAAVGVQVWAFRERVVVVVAAAPEEEGKRGRGVEAGRRWRRVSGWMRGWVPSVGGNGGEAAEERRRLLDAGGEGRVVGGGYGAVA